MGILIGDALHHPLGEQARERFIEAEQAPVPQHLGEEARVEQVQDRVLDAAHVLVHRQPAVNLGALKRQGGVVGIAIAQVVPAGTHEGVHGVGLAPGRLAAAGAGHVHPILQLGQGGSPFAAEGHLAGQLHRQLLGGHRHHAAAGAVDHRNRAAPVALAGDQPIAQAILNLAPTPALALGGGGDRRFRAEAGQAIEAAGVDQHAGLGPGAALKGVLIAALGDDHLAHRQLVAAGEQEIALVVGGHAHHRAGAVFRQHVVGDPEGHQLAIGWIAHPGADRHAPFRAVLGGAFLVALTTHQITEGLHGDGLVGGGEAGHQGMLRCQHHITHAENRVGPGGEHGDRLAAGLPFAIHQGEIKLGAAGAADPVGLHRAHPLRPALQLREVIEQLVGVGGDLQEPLPQLPLLHEGAGTPGASLPIHLLVGQHRLVHRIPVHRGFAPVGEPRLQELEEQPLGPAVVVAVAGGHFPIPVDRETELTQLLPHRGDVAVGPIPGFDAPLDGSVLCWQAEGIPAHRVEHPVAAQPRCAGDHVCDHVVAHMAHVQVPRRIGEHREGIETGAIRFRRRVVEALLGPGLLPVAFNLLGPVPARFSHGGM